MNNNLFVPLTSNPSNHLKPKENCIVCGARNIKVHRRYNGEPYCISCYFQWFKKKPCSKCGEIHRFHISDDKKICSDCIRQQPCIRCGNDAIVNGRNTQYGRVCQVCYQNYFKEKKVCAECGEYKSNVSRYKNIGHNEAICQSCYQKYTHETCPCCHRYRKLVETVDGKMCQKCHDLGQISCPNCQKPMWAGFGEKCWDCYWSQKLEHEVKLNQFLFKNETVKDSYTAFLEWFSKTKGSRVASIKQNNFIDFFARCDELWCQIPSYDLLISEFKPNGLRRYLTVLRWLIATNQIEVENTLKDNMAEEERISQLFAKLGEETPSIVQEYYDYLLERQQAKGTALKTVRLSLQPVVDIYDQFFLKNAHTPSQEQIDAYLKLKSGQANSLSSFIVFLREKYQINLKGNPPSKKIIDTIKKKDAENEIIRLSKLPKPLSEKDRFKWLQMSLVYFHGLTLSVKSLKNCQIIEHSQPNMQFIRYDEKDYVIPKPSD